ncbi:helix-turn-helix domain-containing protein [Allorhizocola rhizosphaerae]|uniref:helix-turn-helix domain-containing protein n=1 Tax=Allorhizocola rhizosphaerae TaxID=1872709 RepID=UPI000E3DF9E4|nr:helix-turn-helix transcriptional regulator [Allorhizocola rhizosphaerae]
MTGEVRRVVRVFDAVGEVPSPMESKVAKADRPGTPGTGRADSTMWLCCPSRPHVSDSVPEGSLTVNQSASTGRSLRGYSDVTLLAEHLSLEWPEGSAVQVDEPVSPRDRFGRELRRWRRLAGLTQVQLAARLGYDHTYISKVESGDRIPPIDFARRADDVLNAGGGLIAIATTVLANQGAADDTAFAYGPIVTPLPGAAWSRRAPSLPNGFRRGGLPTLGVTCPLHGDDRCLAESPDDSVADLFGFGGGATVGVEAVHGFITLLRGFIDADIRRTAADIVVPVEQTVRAIVGLIPRARGRVAGGLMQVAARYADLAGWLRVERGQYGIGMMWLQRAVEWGQSSGNAATVCEALGRMSTVARLEGDGLTALSYAEAVAAVYPARRWACVLSGLLAARSHAHLGDQREFDSHALEAQRLAERLGEQDFIEAPWLFGAEGEAFVASHLSGGLRDLADATGDDATASRATKSAEASLANIPERMYPSRLLLTLRVADTYACRGDTEAAVAVARPVMTAAASAKTVLIRAELNRLRARLGPEVRG